MRKIRPTAGNGRGVVDPGEVTHPRTTTPVAAFSQGSHTTMATVRRALAPDAVTGPLLCAALLIIVEVVGGQDLPARAWAGQALAVLGALAVNLLTSRRAGLRLVHTQQQLHQAVEPSRTARPARQASRSTPATCPRRCWPAPTPP